MRLYENEDLRGLCRQAGLYIKREAYEELLGILGEAMRKYPDSPVPHNLLGLMREEMGDHTGAMKHFRASYALAPDYEPGRHNMELYGGATEAKKPYYSEIQTKAFKTEQRKEIWNRTMLLLMNAGKQKA